MYVTYLAHNRSDSYQCALRREQTATMYSIDDKEMSIIDAFNWIFCLLFPTMCRYLD